MKCDSVNQLIESYADEELALLRRWSVRRHLQHCAGCAGTLADLTALRRRVRRELPRFGTPPELRARILALSADFDSGTAAPVRPESARWRWLSGGALAGCAATVLAIMVGNALTDLRARNDLAVAAVEIHVRATLDGHQIEVASSDRHTVKPWLSARLDYSPPVRDLSSEGFVLLGARLEMLHDRKVATLVYRYRQHTIDVFVQPEARAPMIAASSVRTVRGFNVISASGSGMSWLAVSDVNPDVLRAFAERLSRPDTG